MYILKSKESGKYFAITSDKKNLEACKTIKTATVFAENQIEILKKWIEPMKNQIEICVIQLTESQNILLNNVRYMQYNQIN